MPVTAALALSFQRTAHNLNAAETYSAFMHATAQRS